MSRISWGKPRIWAKDTDTNNAPWFELPTPVEGSTTLTPTKGDKIEAKIEGGEAEDVKYKRSTYQTVFNIRKAKDRNAPFPSVDGRVENHYALMLQPEDPTCEGFYISDNTVTVDDTYTAEEGAMWGIQMDALLDKSGGDTVKWGVVSVVGDQPVFTEGSSKEDTTYTAVSTSSSGYSNKNPKNEGWYERTGSDPYFYRQTWDETPMSGKTYYTKS